MLRSNKRKEIRRKIREATERRRRGAAPPAEAIPVARPVADSGSLGQYVPAPKADPGPVGTINCLCGKELTIFPNDDRKEVHCAACERSIKIGIVTDAAWGTSEIIPIYPPDPAPVDESAAIPRAVPEPKPSLVTEEVELPAAEEPISAAPLAPAAPAQEPSLVPEAVEIPVPAANETESAPIVETAPPPVLPSAPKPGRAAEITEVPLPAPEEPVPVLEAAVAAPASPPKSHAQPPPPAALQFKCTCGRGLVAKRAVYGGRMRCHRCATWLAIEPRFDEAKKIWAIEPTPSSEPSA